MTRHVLMNVGMILGLSAGVAAAQTPDLPESFDYMGPEVETTAVPDGRTVAYVDTGPQEGAPVLFIGGTGTSAAVVGLTDFLRTMREDLGLRLISVGRAGFGRTDPAEDWTFEDYATDATAVLDQLGVDDVAVMAISGGGPYAAAFAAEHPDRVTSLHLAAATALAERSELCDDPERMREVFDRYAAHPLEWWDLGEDSPTERIPGFSTAAADDGARTFSIAGQKGSGAAEVAEYRRYCDLPMPDVSGVDAPVYIYQGLQDATVTPANADRWEEVFPNVVARRDYPERGHDVQYRHWDQILVDMAGHGDSLVICREGRSELVSEAEVEDALSGEVTLGVCAWAE